MEDPCLTSERARTIIGFSYMYGQPDGSTMGAGTVDIS